TAQGQLGAEAGGQIKVQGGHVDGPRLGERGAGAEIGDVEVQLDASRGESDGLDAGQGGEGVGEARLGAGGHAVEAGDDVGEAAPGVGPVGDVVEPTREAGNVDLVEGNRDAGEVREG